MNIVGLADLQDRSPITQAKRVIYARRGTKTTQPEMTKWEEIQEYIASEATNRG